MSIMTTDATMADVIAREIRRHRQARGLTVKQLADECARLGATQLTATALTNIERGHGESGKGGRPRTSASAPRRRRDVSHNELMVLARALGIPPALLLFPVGANEQVEVLPGRQASAWGAFKWFAGLEPFPGPVVDGLLSADVEDFGAWQTGAAPITMRLEHARLVDLWRRTTTDAANNRRMAEGAVSDEARAEFARRADQAAREALDLERELGAWRRFMNRQDVTPDQLPADLTHVDDSTPPPPARPREDDHSAAMWGLLAQTLGADRELLEASTDDTVRAVLGERVKADVERLRAFEDRWRERRAELRRQGVTPDPLPSTLAHIDE